MAYIPTTLKFDSNNDLVYTKHISSAADMLRIYNLVKREQETETDWSELLRSINDELDNYDRQLQGLQII